jgi:Ca-activated chloride channel family protein
MRMAEPCPRLVGGGASAFWGNTIRTRLLLVLAAFAAAPAARPQITARVELVNVDVTVTDARGNFVRGLKRENFRVLDNGVEQPVTHFASIDAPATVLVLVETSPAVFMLHHQHLDAAYALLGGLAAEDQAALATYDESARLLLPFSADKRALQRAIENLRYNLGRGDLRFYDALVAALGWLEPIPGKKALVLLTTGLDTSGRPWQEVAQRFHASEVAVYSVALGGELRDFRGTSEAQQLSFEESDRVLREMAEITGGRTFFPRKADELPGIYRMLASTLRHRYSLGFAPPVRDAQFHRIFVQLRDDRGRLLGPFYPELEAPATDGTGASGTRQSDKTRVRYRIHARRGYVAPAP